VIGEEGKSKKNGKKLGSLGDQKQSSSKGPGGSTKLHLQTKPKQERKE